MKLAPVPEIEQHAVLKALGYAPGEVEEETAAQLRAACRTMQQMAAPRWVYRRFALQPGAAQPTLAEAALPLPGGSIARHLAKCSAAVVLAVTLGSAADTAIRAAEATSMAMAVLLDAAASQLVEQCAEACEELLRRQAEAQGQYLTARFSPGYGDLPLALQPRLAALLDAPRAIGLTVNAGGLLLPRKSITAICGVAAVPVTGHLAGCEDCALRESCDGTACGGARATTP